MEIAKEETPVEQPKEQKLTRLQRRALERANQQASAMHQRLANQFAEFFIDSDPDSEEVIEKQKEVNAKWRMYCKSKGLTPEVFGLVNDSCNKFREQFNNELNEAALPS